MKKEKIPLPKFNIFCSTDEFRPIINCVLIDNGYGISSDAHILVKIDVSGHFENIEKANQKLIHRSVWNQMMWANKRTCTETGIICRFDNFTCTFEYYSAGTYPNYMAVLEPAYKKAVNASIGSITFMPWNIERLSRFKRDLPIRFYFYGEDQPVFFQTSEYYGLIMPCVNSFSPEKQLAEIKHEFKRKL